MRVWQAHERAVLGLAFAPDGGALLWAPNDSYLTTANTLTLIDVPAGHPWGVLEVPGPVHDAALAPGGRTLAAAVRGDVQLWAVGGLPPPPKPRPKRPGESRRRGRAAQTPAPPHTPPGLVLPGAA